MDSISRVILLGFLFLLSLGNYALAYADKGLESYRNGDYATALKEWKLLAEKGDPRGQNNLESGGFSKISRRSSSKNSRAFGAGP